MFVGLLPCIYYTIGGSNHREINIQSNNGALFPEKKELFQKNKTATDWRGGRRDGRKVESGMREISSCHGWGFRGRMVRKWTAEENKEGLKSAR